ncbi:MAG TPA: enoyl-CoA hydratase/isomerase family protein [Terriglobia bacterium]
MGRLITPTPDRRLDWALENDGIWYSAERVGSGDEPEAQGAMTIGEKISTAVATERCGDVARVLINRHPLNVLDLATIDLLGGTLREALDDPDVRLVEIHGRATAFSAGVEIRDHFLESAPAMLAAFHALIRSVLYARLPVIAVVRGFCLGGGMELALAADFVVAAEDASFGQPEIGVGCFAPVASVLLPRLIPAKKALELLLSGKMISGTEAEELGFVNRTAPSEVLEAELGRFEKELLARSPAVLALARKAARIGTRASFESALHECERIYLEELLPTEDAREGVRSFLEKREPVWKGR